MFPNSSCMYNWISEDGHPKKWEQRDFLILALYTVVHSKVSLPVATYWRLYPDVGDISEKKAEIWSFGFGQAHHMVYKFCEIWARWKS